MKSPLVITADDFGANPVTNAAIVDLLVSGRITTTTLMPISPAAQDAATRFLAAGLDSGLESSQVKLHFGLTSPDAGPSYHPLTSDRSLVDAVGALRPDSAVAQVEAKVPDKVVQAELAAQYGWMLDRGLQPAGLDAHCGVLYGLFGGSSLPGALQLCAEHKMSFRLPRNARLLLGPELADKFADQLAAAVGLADQLGVRLPYSVAAFPMGALHPGSYSQLKAWYLRLLDQIVPRGVSELFLHPAPPDVASEPFRGWEWQLLNDSDFQVAVNKSFDLVPGW